MCVCCCCCFWFSADLLLLRLRRRRARKQRSVFGEQKAVLWFFAAFSHYIRLLTHTRACIGNTLKTRIHTHSSKFTTERREKQICYFFTSAVSFTTCSLIAGGGPAEQLEAAATVAVEAFDFGFIPFLAPGGLRGGIRSLTRSSPLASSNDLMPSPGFTPVIAMCVCLCGAGDEYKWTRAR